MKGKSVSTTEEILQFVTLLYQASRHMQPDDFKQWTITQLRQLIHFDSAWWGRALFPEHSDTPEVHGNSLFQLPDNYFEQWQKIADCDTIAENLYNNASEPFMAEVHVESMSGALCDFLWHHDIYHVLSFMKVDPELLLDAKGNMGDSMLVDFLSLYRNRKAVAFQPEDQDCLRLVMPHIALSLNHCLEFSVLTSQNTPTNNAVEVAMFDSGFMLNTPSLGFTALIKRDYPDWDGCVLPEEIQQSAQCKTTSWKGRHFTLTFESMDSYWCSRAYPSSLLSELTEREAQVAELFAQGKTYMEIAEEIHRAPATVRNHLQSIYLKLGIRNKVELVEKYRSLM
ncbi:helix-turn-helix transcriptional regulator [Enterovibrio sp. ZSDZ35]|uniref:Helix-turn-helix transcriptional regulator n=1 Tax=Enterovibrio qingdaonensis TaxID=2899818 RepID=A0ABT5QHH4_9GAMM|nr:helix-turn-helix transcriptional regulator [Enterovibrio sp. ZSDZ35]MDD1780437.1 helix-turn-helix transcriptional regulator [Enterovibrio sp. ZSDZ35]